MNTQNCVEPYSDPFPFKRSISLELLITFWKNQADSDTSHIAEIAKTVLARLDDAPELKAHEVSIEDLEKHSDLLDLLMTAVFPSAGLDHLIAAAFVPFELKSIYATTGFEKLEILQKFLDQNSLQGCCFSVEDMMLGKAMSAYHKIVSTYYGVKMPRPIPFVLHSPSPETGLTRYYRVSIDPRFVQIDVRNGLPKVSPTDVQRLYANPLDLELWMSILPPEHFEFRGFGVMNAVHVTGQEVLSNLKNDLLLKGAMTNSEIVDRLERHMQELLDLPDVRLGLISLDRCRSGNVSDARALNKSLLISDGLPDCPDPTESYYASVVETGQSVFVNDLRDAERQTGLEKRLIEQGLVNLYIGPLKVRDEIVGLFELASPNVSDITSVYTPDLQEVNALFAMAMKRSMEEQEDRVQAIVKRQYTAIHPVVEWRFQRAALNHLVAIESGETAELESIVFQDVHSLYGMSDIRGSSVLRNTAIQKDITEQMGLALAVVIAASTVQPRPSLDELGYRLSRHIEEIVAGLRSGDEHSIVLLLQGEVEPLFDRLAELSPDVALKVKSYRDALDPVLGIIYQKRQAYEAAVTSVNETISAFLDRAEDHAQSMVPHYFEKYKTDGVDYNIYAGASLIENGSFDDLDLKNLKIWQLTTMAGIVWEMNRQKTRMKMPLETAHLILVQSAPLSIRFRVDEKKFDVDGAYNIRYEIIKKRIDKALIAGTSERLTQPGKIAIVYSTASEADEYMRYIDYLQAAGYMDPGVEKLELEELQGVSGLRALRVTVAEESPFPGEALLGEVENAMPRKEQTIET